MTRNPGRITLTMLSRLGILAAGAFLAQTVVAAPSAVAAPSPSTLSADIVVTATMSGTNTACTSHWRWQAANAANGNYSEVEWTSNPCGFSIQERSWCVDAFSGSGAGGWATSGVVLRTGLWDKTSCSSAEDITRGEWRFESSGGWSTYKTFWTP